MTNLPEHLKRQIEVSDECWLWTGAKDQSGYGKARCRGHTTRKAHRIVYAILVSHDETRCLDHLCRVRHCVNPEHLEPVSNAENLRRGAAVRTHFRCGHAIEGNTCFRWKGKGRKQRACRTCQNAKQRARRLV